MTWMASKRAFFDLCRAANIARVVSVQLSSPNSAGCVGTQVYAPTSSLSCNPVCEQGPASSSADCGTSLGVPTYCCYHPTILWTALANPSPTPTNVQAYPLISLPVMVGRNYAISRVVACAWS